MVRFVSAAAVLFGSLLAGCGPRYERVDGAWAWVTHDEGFGKRVWPLDADDATFEVLDGGRFARDAESVFFDGGRLDGADAASFEVLGDLYARDARRAYTTVHPIPEADPATFEVLGFPYARDARDVYYGTVPMRVAEPAAFEVVETSDGRSISTVRNLTTMRHPPSQALGDALLARGYAPDSTVVLGSTVGKSAGVGRVGSQRYEGALAVP